MSRAVQTYAVAWLLAAVLPVAAAERKVEVADDAGLREALSRAEAGWRIVLTPGVYRPGVYARELHGTAESPIILEGRDPQNKPVFEGGAEALHFSGCVHLTLRNLATRGQSGNGINIDDGGAPDAPAHHITLEGLHVSDVGPRGNHDGIKLSGVDDLLVRDCTVEGWGGQAIDMVGCHRALIEACTFRGKPNFSQDTGPQAKGGSADVTIRDCTLLNAGQRGVNIGGSTDPNVFRPRGAGYEAKNVTVEGCRFVGSPAPVAFVGVDGATVRYNTIYHPDKWVLRILQETTRPGFLPCRNGRFERNLVVFRGGQVSTAVNVGPHTEPGSFAFHENYWFCDDQPAHSRPDLPTPEWGGVYGIDPGVTPQPGGVPSAPAAEAAKGFGAEATRPPRLSWFPVAPPLPGPTGQVIRVATVEELFRAADEVRPGGTILVADGHYPMPRYLDLHADGVTLRGESGDRGRVVLDGARSRRGELLGVTGCSGVTVADLTIRNARTNGFKINSDRFATRVTIYNCVVNNVWQRGVKGPAVRAEDRGRFRPSDCRVQYCLFYNDRPKQFADDPDDTTANFGGNYVGGIDAMYARRWTISDNVFAGIRGRTGAARGAVFLWQEAEDCVVERNVVVDCDSGICLGNSYKPADVPVHCRSCVVRNNFVTRCPEQGILADYTRDCRIVHNTIHDPGSTLRRLVRLVHDDDGLLVANNLLGGPPVRVETDSRVRIAGNVVWDQGGAFADARSGDLHLKRRIVRAEDAVEPAATGVTHDIDGRQRGPTPDAGADEPRVGEK